MYRVKIIRNGILDSFADGDDYDSSCEYAYHVLSESYQEEKTGKWAGTITSGRLFVDHIGEELPMFFPDGNLFEGLVLDAQDLNDPGLDTDHLFGLK